MEFDKLTPSEKREARLQAWQHPEGIQFADKDVEQAYKRRVQMLSDVVKLKKPERVPISISTGFYPFVYSGYSCRDPMYDYEKLGNAMRKFHADFLPDVMATSALYGPGRAFEVMDYKLYRWPGHGVPENTPYQCAEAEFMKADEYSLFLRDHTDYFLRYYFPRIFGALDPWKTLPPFTDILELPFTGPALIHFGMPHIQESLKKLMEAGAIALDWIARCGEIDHSVKTSLGLPSFMGAFSKAPLDTLGDTLRGTRAILLDKFRKPKEMLEAIDRIIPLAIDMGVRNTPMGAPPTVFIPLHKGADSFMSRDDFKKFYWPSLKAVILGLIKEGLIPYSFVEGSYDQRLDIITDPDIPAGSTIWFFDRTDMKEVKKRLGGWACFAGNFPSSLLKTATPQQVKDHAKRLLDDVAGDGGYFMSNGAVLDDAQPENLHALIDTVKVCGVYK